MQREPPRSRMRDGADRERRARRRAAAPPLVDASMIVVAVLLAAVPLRAGRGKPVLRRLALRNAARRPRETAARRPRVVARHRDHDRVVRRRRHVQLVDPARARTSSSARSTRSCRPNGLAGGAGAAGAARRLHAIPNVDGVLPLTSRRAVGRDRRRRRVRAAPKAQLLETDFAAARGVRRRRARDRASPARRPAPGEAAIGADLARDAARRRRRRDRRVRVRRDGTGCRSCASSRKLGVAGFWAGDEHTSNNVFVAPGTIAGIFARGTPRRGAPPQSVVLVSNRGGVEAGAAALRRGRAARSPRGSARVDDERQRPQAGGARPRRSQRAVAVAALHVARHVRACSPGSCCSSTSSSCSPTSGSRSSACCAPSASAARSLDRRVRDRGLVLRGRCPRSRARSSGSVSAALIMAVAAKLLASAARRHRASRCTSRSRGRACSAGSSSAS